MFVWMQGRDIHGLELGLPVVNGTLEPSLESNYLCRYPARRKQLLIIKMQEEVSIFSIFLHALHRENRINKLSNLLEMCHLRYHQ